MKKMIIGAAVLLVVQLGLVLLVRFGTNTIEAIPPGTKFLSFVPEKITEFELTDSEGGHLIAKKDGDTWVLPTTYNGPADSNVVLSFLKKLSGLKQGFVVATSKESVKRLKVSEDGFEHHVVLKTNGQSVADFFVGTSPAFRQVHARKKGTDEVVSLEISGYELDGKLTTWLSKSMASVPQDQIAEIIFPKFTLIRVEKTEKTKESWQLNDLGDGEKMNTTEAEDLARKVRDFTVQDLVDPKVAEPLFVEKPALSFSLKRKDGKDLSYTFVQATDKEAYILKRSDSDFYMSIHSLPVESLQKVHRANLLEKPEVVGAESEKKVKKE